jgi:hypothetical protein
MTTYTPKTKQQSAAADTAALPRDLAAALTAADELLNERNRTFRIVTEAHNLYPSLLRERAQRQAELGAAELSGNRPAIDQARDAYVKAEAERKHCLSRRNGGLEFLIGQEKVLTEAQETLDSARGAYSMSAVAEFTQRYKANIAQLRALWSEAEALSSALRVAVPTELPVKLVGGVDTGIHPWPGNIEPARLVRVTGTPTPATIEPGAAKIGQALDGLASALRYVGGLAQHRRLEGQPPRATSHSNPDPAAVYIAQKDFIVHADGLPITAGTWIDAPFVGFNTLARHRSVKSIIPVPSAKAEAAA